MIHEQRLSSDEDEQNAFLPRLHSTHKKSTSRNIILFTLLNLVALVVNVIFIIQWTKHETTNLNSELRQASTYSITDPHQYRKTLTLIRVGPLYDLLDLGRHVQMINGTLFPTSDPSIARQMPNAAADEVWEEWEITRVFPISRSDLIQLGKDPLTAVKLEDENWGLGDDAYASILDVYHQLHCLNSLRQIAYGEYYNMTIGRTDEFTSK